jgi:predicted tellurium resistance membrane protein TerC
MLVQELLSGLSTIAGLVVLEGLLSVDNVLGIAALASELPEPKQRPAIRVGLGLAYAFGVDVEDEAEVGTQPRDAGDSGAGSR